MVTLRMWMRRAWLRWDGPLGADGCALGGRAERGARADDRRCYARGGEIDTGKADAARFGGDGERDAPIGRTVASGAGMEPIGHGSTEAGAASGETASDEAADRGA